MLAITWTSLHSSQHPTASCAPHGWTIEPPGLLHSPTSFMKFFWSEPPAVTHPARNFKSHTSYVTFALYIKLFFPPQVPKFCVGGYTMINMCNIILSFRQLQTRFHSDSCGYNLKIKNMGLMRSYLETQGRKYSGLHHWNIWIFLKNSD
jgi:hypothetical protein